MFGTNASSKVLYKLVRGPITLDQLHELFGADKSSIRDDFEHIVDIIIHSLKDEVKFPTKEQRKRLHGTIDGFHYCIGFVDITELPRPRFEPLTHCPRTVLFQTRRKLKRILQWLQKAIHPDGTSAC